jgi:arginyl-tRNA synthetase
MQQLPNDESRQALKTLLIKLDSFEETLINAAKLRMPHIVVRYLLDLSADFHYFYNLCRILTDDPQVTKPRLLVIVAIQRVLKQGLALLGVSAPEQM